ncbi:hypothetical protein J2853_005733 [Streptosporangium lutulentum]|uniref:Uncharacterized protein n=1 Tax=Streptosporangium lutulentum TaxID=1461250 RepID=A0ABT9QIE1_9ACTN|nr:hypothetical protein [Streptosporangium lutulentum]
MFKNRFRGRSANTYGCAASSNWEIRAADGARPTSRGPRHPSPEAGGTARPENAGRPDTAWEEPHPVSRERGTTECPHESPCPSSDAPDHDAARLVASHPEQGWGLLCNGVVVFDDTGELLPDGRSVPAHRGDPGRAA